jgi:hypothetical protein
MAGGLFRICESKITAGKEISHISAAAKCCTRERDTKAKILKTKKWN